MILDYWVDPQSSNKHLYKTGEEKVIWKWRQKLVFGCCGPRNSWSHQKLEEARTFPGFFRGSPSDSSVLEFWLPELWGNNIFVVLSHQFYDDFFYSRPRDWGFPGGSVVENPPANAGDTGSIPGLGRSPWRRVWQPTPIFLPGESHQQRSLTGCSPWGHTVEHDWSAAIHGVTKSRTQLSDWTELNWTELKQLSMHAY